MPFNGPNPRRPCLFWADPVPLLLVSGILIQFLDINTTTSVRHTAFLYTMPLGYFVGAGGRVGPELWVALDRRTSSSRLARPRASACCYRTSQQPFLCPVGANGRPIEVRLPFNLATWLILGTITVTDEVCSFFIYQYFVGAERLGAALDLALGGYDDNTPISPSVLRSHLLRVAATLRGDQPIPFTATAACLIIVGGQADNLEGSNLATPLLCPPISPAWAGHVTFGDLLAPDSTALTQSELEPVWQPRWFASQRSTAGGFSMMERLLGRALAVDEAAIITALPDVEKSEQYVELANTLLPTSDQLTSFPASAASAALALSRSFARAISPAGSLSVSVHDALTVIAHHEPFRLAIGTEVGAPAALGMLPELVRAALKAPTAQLSLGNVNASSEIYKYLTGRLIVMHASHTPPSDRVAFLARELEERRKHEQMSRGDLSAVASEGAGGGGAGGGGAGSGGGQERAFQQRSILGDPLRYHDLAESVSMKIRGLIL